MTASLSPKKSFKQRQVQVSTKNPAEIPLKELKINLRFYIEVILQLLVCVSVQTATLIPELIPVVEFVHEESISLKPFKRILGWSLSSSGLQIPQSQLSLTLLSPGNPFRCGAGLTSGPVPAAFAPHLSHTASPKLFPSQTRAEK